MAMPTYLVRGAGNLEVAGSQGVIEVFHLFPGQCTFCPSFEVRLALAIYIEHIAEN